jgi:electron transport complex protein RnfG
VGCAFTTEAKGYGGTIRVLTGINPDGTVAGVEILEITETAGLGMKAKEVSFREQYAGKSAAIGLVVSKGGAAPGNSIDALTGATITSKAVTEAVNLALRLFAER